VDDRYLSGDCTALVVVGTTGLNSPVALLLTFNQGKVLDPDVLALVSRLTPKMLSDVSNIARMTEGILYWQG
jgi:hypothetical protein